MPVRDGSGAIVAVLDVDSDKPGQFDEVDAEGLQSIVELAEVVTGLIFNVERSNLERELSLTFAVWCYYAIC